MTEYEKSFEKENIEEDEDEFFDEEPEYEKKITNMSSHIIEWILKTTEKFAEMWEGTVTVSYDEMEPIRDYVIKIRVKEIFLYNIWMREELFDLLREADCFLVQPCSIDKNKVEMIVVHSNGENIIPEEEDEF